MKGLRHNIFRKGQTGFTIIEVMAAIALTSILSLGAAIASGQLLNQSSKDTNYTAASRHAANAIYWIGRDVLMAQKMEGWQDFPATALSLSWKDWDNTAYSANYTVTGGVLTRTFNNGFGVTSTRIAEDINTVEEMTWCTSDNGTVTLTVTASAGQGAKIIDVTKTRVIANRPGL